MILARAPLCADPWGYHAASGRTVAADEVHHILPATERPDLFYTRSNLLPLCQRCHTRTRTEALPAAFLGAVKPGAPNAAPDWPAFEGEPEGSGTNGGGPQL